MMTSSLPKNAADGPLVSGPSDDTIIRTLSEAPPDEWGAWLEALGASVRPVGKNQQDAGPACTISSLLGMMEPPVCNASSSSTSAAPSREVAPTSKTGARARAKRRSAAEIASHPAEQDVRNLDDLLRDLGEPTESKKKQVKELATKKSGKAGKKKSSMKNKPVGVVRKASDHDDKEHDEEDVDVEDSDSESIRKDTEEEEVEGASPTEESLYQSTDEQEVVARAVSIATDAMAVALSEVQEEAQSDEAAELDATSTAVPEDEAQDEDAASEASKSPLSHSLSEGNLPQVHKSERDHQETLATSNVLQQYYSQPSVATWMQVMPATLFASAISSCSSSVPHDNAQPAQELPPMAWCQSQTPCWTPLQWNARPSVGTWLAPPISQRLQPGSQSPTAATSTSEKNEEKTQLWPDTPTSTPPSSPRCAYDGNTVCGPASVVWVPVPVHLLEKVQRLIGQEHYGSF